MKKATCFGAGLVALDVILNGSPTTLPKLSAGGSCGNVLSILSYLGWNTYPVARLANNIASEELLKDLNRWRIHTDYISITEEGSTPIIIHRILKNKVGKPIHRFEFRDPSTGTWLPQFKPITKIAVSAILQHDFKPEVFYFDRMNPGTLDLVKELKSRGAIIYFEPSSAKDAKQFDKFLGFVDILKYSSDRIPEYKDLYPESQCFLEIETQGEKGLLFRSKNRTKPNEWKAVSGFKLPLIQDAAGAGDWCSAGIIRSLCAKGKDNLYETKVKDVEYALQFGQALGAMNCLFDGARGLMYFYAPKVLLKAIERLMEEKDIATENIPSKVLIDTSTDKKFSDLY